MKYFTVLSEFLVIRPQTTIVEPSTSSCINSQEKPDFKWNANQTKRLLDLYALYKNQVGTFKIKTLKHMWQIIAEQLKTDYNVDITDQNCLNRWRVLERSYKKFVDNQNATGRGRKYFEYQEQMETIFKGKKSITPDFLLESNTIDNQIQKEIVEEIQEETAQNEKKTSKPKILKRKRSVMESVRADRKEYYAAKLIIENEKLEEIRKRNKLTEQRNKLLKERNNILKEKPCCNDKV